MEVSFDYEDKGISPFGRIYRPIAEVIFSSATSTARVIMVVDTGADYSILPRSVAERLRISLSKDCLRTTTQGVGGGSAVYFHKSKIKANLGAIEKKVPVAFLDSDEVPPLLGRLGFLEIFDVLFRKSHRVVFKD